MARELFEDAAIRAALAGAAESGEPLSADDDERISDVVVRCVDERGWKKPNPANLLIAVVLARRFATGEMDPSDREAAFAFIEDRSCDDNDPVRRRMRPVRVSEIVPLLRAIESRPDIKAPYEAVRGRKLSRGESFFVSEQEEDEARFPLLRITRDYIIDNALMNRYNDPFNSIKNILGMYASRKIEIIDSNFAIEWLVGVNSKTLIDDRLEG